MLDKALRTAERPEDAVLEHGWNGGRQQAHPGGGYQERTAVGARPRGVCDSWPGEACLCLDVDKRVAMWLPYAVVWLEQERAQDQKVDTVSLGCRDVFWPANLSTECRPRLEAPARAGDLAAS